MVNSVKLNQYNQCYIKYGFLYNRARSAKTIVFPKGLNTFQFLYCTVYTYVLQFSVYMCTPTQIRAMQSISQCYLLTIHTSAFCKLHLMQLKHDLRENELKQFFVNRRRLYFW